MRLDEILAGVRTWLKDAEDQDCPPDVFAQVMAAKQDLKLACDLFYSSDDDEWQNVVYDDELRMAGYPEMAGNEDPRISRAEMEREDWDDGPEVDYRDSPW